MITNEGDVWFTRKKGEDTVYAFLTKAHWTLGQRRSFTLRSVAATPETRVSVLGQTGELLEYRPDVDPRTRWRTTDQGLEIDVMQAQRYYDDHKWPNAVVVKLTRVTPAMTPPAVTTRDGARSPNGATATLRAELSGLGGSRSVEVGFQYRRRKGTEELYTPDDPWISTALVVRTGPGAYSIDVGGLRADAAYEFRAMVKHPLLTVFGEDRQLATQ